MKFLIILVLPFLLCSCLKMKKQSRAPLYRVDVGEVMNEIKFTGRVRSENSVLVRAPFDSNLVRLSVTLGQKIRLGQEIAILSKPEDSGLNTSLISKRGQLDQLEYKREQLKLKIATNEKEIARISRLVSSGSVSKSEREKIQVANALEKKELKILDSKIITTKGEIRYLEQKTRESSQVLKSPISGTVTELWIEESNVTPGMNVNKDTVMAIVEKFGSYLLKGDVSEPDYIRMEIGQPVLVSLSYLENYRWRGRLKSLAPKNSSDVSGIGRFSASVSFVASEGQIKTGLEGVGRILLSRKEKVVRVPRSAVSRQKNKYFISYSSEAGTQKKEIQVGIIGDEFIEVTDGLTQESRIYKHYKH